MNTHYEEDTSEGRNVRDRLYVWGKEHVWPLIRFQHKAGVPLMTYYPIISSSERCWRDARDEWFHDIVAAALAYCKQYDQMPISEERQLRDRFYAWEKITTFLCSNFSFRGEAQRSIV